LGTEGTFLLSANSQDMLQAVCGGRGAVRDKAFAGAWLGALQGVLRQEKS